MTDTATNPTSPSTSAPSTPTPVKHTLDQQRVNDAWIAIRYEVRKDGVWRRKSLVIEGEPPAPPNLHEGAPSKYQIENLERVADRPCYVSAIGQREDDGIELVALTFLQTSDPAASGDKWATIWVGYEQIANVNELLKLAVHVFPVKTSNARALSDFLTECHTQNLGLLRRSTIVRRMGLHDIDGTYGWLIGERWIGPGNVRPEGFSASDKIASGLKSHGSVDEWTRWTREQWEKEWIVRWVLGVSFASPLLEFIGLRTFVVHHYRKSYSAKTVLAMIGQSVWGHPKQQTVSLNMATQTGLNEIFKYITSLPVLIDDTQGAHVDLSDFLMQACSEEHKIRAKVTGGLIGQDAKKWRMIIRTTGEQTISGASKTDLGGQATRAVEFRHPGLQAEHGKKAWQWLERAQQFGTAGPAFLARLSGVVNDGEKLGALCDRYRSFLDTLEKWSGQSRPLEQQMAAIALGEYLMLQWIYGLDRATAITMAIEDACNVMQNWLRARDAAAELWRKGLDVLMEHRFAYAHAYADVATPDGRVKLAQSGSRSAMPVVGAINAGLKEDEIWYLPTQVNKVLYNALQAPPDRFWEDLAQEGILLRGSDRLVRQREIEKGKVFEGKVYVLKQDRVFTAPEAGPSVDLGDLLMHSLADFEEVDNDS